MDSVDLETLMQCDRWLASGHRVLLATVVETFGSSPRPPGAMLAVRDDGEVAGSVSGGCIEDDLVARVRAREIAAALPTVTAYGVTTEEAHRFGLPCGGSLKLVLEPLGPGSAIPELARELAAGRVVTRRLELSSGEATLAPAQATDAVGIVDGVLTTVHGPRYRLLLIGAGQLSRYVAQIAMALDYRVTVCDPRVEYTGGWNIAGVEVTTSMPDDAVVEMSTDPRCAIVALTHDPKLDDLALLEALKSPAFYVGALGSRVTNARRRARLREFDLGDSEIARLHGPTGVYIGARTPPEIAVSIVAEITAARYRVTPGVREEIAPGRVPPAPVARCAAG